MFFFCNYCRYSICTSFNLEKLYIGTFLKKHIVIYLTAVKKEAQHNICIVLVKKSICTINYGPNRKSYRGNHS